MDNMDIWDGYGWFQTKKNDSRWNFLDDAVASFATAPRTGSLKKSWASRYLEGQQHMKNQEDFTES